MRRGRRIALRIHIHHFFTGPGAQNHLACGVIYATRHSHTVACETDHKRKAQRKKGAYDIHVFCVFQRIAGFNCAKMKQPRTQIANGAKSI